MKKNKLRVGIDINEILRSRWLKFDQLFVEEFGEENAPEPEVAYVYDFFKNYTWKDTTTQIKTLKELDEMPENISPLDYQVDENNESPADTFLFNYSTETLTAKESYDRFMYTDYLFEIFGSAPLMYKGMDLHVQQFYKKYRDTVEFVIVSKENWFSTPATLFFLSKILTRFKNFKFVDTNEEMWEGVDILITTDPSILTEPIPENKQFIKMLRPYNNKIINEDAALQELQIADLIDNEKFEKLIGYHGWNYRLPEDISNIEQNNWNQTLVTKLNQIKERFGFDEVYIISANERFKPLFETLEDYNITNQIIGDKYIVVFDNDDRENILVGDKKLAICDYPETLKNDN